MQLIYFGEGSVLRTQKKYGRQKNILESTETFQMTVLFWYNDRLYPGGVGHPNKVKLIVQTPLGRRH